MYDTLYFYFTQNYFPSSLTDNLKITTVDLIRSTEYWLVIVAIDS
jgi:hypothetical protein